MERGLPCEVGFGGRRLTRRCLSKNSMRSKSLVRRLTRQGCRRPRPLGRCRSRNSPGTLGRALSSRRPLVRRLGSLIGLEFLRRLNGLVATFATPWSARALPVRLSSASHWALLAPRCGFSDWDTQAKDPDLPVDWGTQAKDPNLPVAWGTQAKDPDLLPPGWFPPSLPPPTPESKTR